MTALESERSIAPPPGPIRDDPQCLPFSVHHGASMPNRPAKGALTGLLHGLVARPRIYDWVQWLVGGGAIYSHLSARASQLTAPSVVLDLGAGTGSLRDIWPRATTYVCLDLDPAKLQGFRRKRPDGNALLADGRRVPIQTASADVVCCVAVTHHLTDDLLDGFMSESRRVLKETGTIILIDAVSAPSRFLGRLLWKYDRGAYPRSAEQLTRALRRHFVDEATERFVIVHEYVLWIGRPG